MPAPRWKRARSDLIGTALRAPRTWSWSAPGIALAGFLASPPAKSAQTPPPSFYWYVDHAASITAIPIAVAGFGFTLIQIKRTRKAAEAAESAAKEAQRGIGRGSLLLLIPQLQRTEDELDRAIEAGEPSLVRFWVGTWRRQANELKGLLKVSLPGESEIQVLIQESSIATADLKDELFENPALDLVIATKPVRAAIAQVTNRLGELGVIQGMQIGQANSV